MANSHEARTPRFLSAAPRLQVEPFSFGGGAPQERQPHLAVVDAPRAAALGVPQAPPAPPPAPAQRAAPPPAPPPAPVQERVVLDPRPTDEMLARVANGVESLRLQGERLAATARSDALEIGFLVARRILEAELSSSPEPLFSLIRSAIRRAGETRTVGVRLHPADLAVVESRMHEPIGPGFSVAEVKLIADSTLERGDCVVEADFGTVDGRLSTRLAELRRALAAEFEGA